MKPSGPWWRVWDCNVHRSCSSIQHALITLAALVPVVAIAWITRIDWLPLAGAVLMSALWAWREESQQSGFWGRRHRTTRGKWDARRDWLYPTIAGLAVAAGYWLGVV